MSDRFDLNDFVDARDRVFRVMVLRRVRVHFIPGKAPSLEQWSKCRAAIVLDRRLELVNMALVDLFDHKFSRPLGLIPGQLFEVRVDAEVADLVRFEFEGDVLR